MSRASVDLETSMLNNSIGAPTPKSLPIETSKTPVQMANFSVPDWVHCESCKRREHFGPTGPSATPTPRLPLAYSHPCGHIICRDCCKPTMQTRNCVLCSKSTHIYPINSNLPPQIKVLFLSRYELVHLTESQVREQVTKLYSNMYKQLFDVFDYQDQKWNALMSHRVEYLRQMNKIKKGMIELEELKRINREVMKIYQEQDLHSSHSHSSMSSIRPASVASSTSLNFAASQQRASTVTNQLQPAPPEPDKLMSYEQAMIYAHPALKDALRIAHRRKMSSKNSGPIPSK